MEVAFADTVVPPPRDAPSRAVAGGLIPSNLRGTVNAALFYITDWYTAPST